MVARKVDEQLDMLMEVVAHTGWRTVRQVATDRKNSHTEALKIRAQSEFDLLRKEILIARIIELDEFLQEIENRVDAYAKHK